MPKKSLVLNGYNGGLNLDSDASDLESKGQGNDELSNSKNLLNDYKGKVNSTIPTSVASGTTADSDVDTSKDELLIYDSEYYQETGLYKHGDKVVYNGSVTITGPTAKALSSSEHEDAIGLNPTLGTEENKNLFVGAGSDVFNGTANQAIFADKDTGWAQNPVTGYDIVSFPNGYSDHSNNGLALYIRGATSEADFDYHDGDWDDGWVNIFEIPFEADTTITFPTDWDGNSDEFDIIPRNGSDVSLIGSGTGQWNSSGLESSGTIDLDHFEWINQDNGSSARYFTQSFLMGEQLWSVVTAGEQVATKGLYSDISQSLENHDIAFEVEFFDRGNIEEISFVFKSASGAGNNDDGRGGTFSADEPRPDTRVYSYTSSQLDDLGFDGNTTRYTIKFDESGFTGQGNLFDPTDIRFCALNVKYVGYGVGDTILKLYALYFIPNENVSSWANNKYIFHQTSLTNETEKGRRIESLPVKYIASTPFDAANASSDGLNFEIIRPDGDSGTPINGKIYWQIADDRAEGNGSKFLLAEVDSDGTGGDPAGNTDTGVKFAGDTEWTGWVETGSGTNIYHVKKNIPNRPESSTYELESGYPDNVEYLNAFWKTAAVVGRQVYIGNVQQPATNISSGTYDGSKILKSAVGKYYGFPDSQYIDLEFGGDEIKVLKGVGDRLFVFSTDKLTIVNVAQDFEVLEGQWENMGVSYHKQVCKVNEGLAWVNTHGVHYFDGNKLDTISDEKMLSVDWSSSSNIGYFPNRKMILVWLDDTKIYSYSFKSRSWAGDIQSGLLIDKPLSTNVISGLDGNAYYVSSDDNAIYRIIESSNTTGIDEIIFETGKIDCGDLSRNKKFKKVYITTTGGLYSANETIQFDTGSGYGSTTNLTAGTQEVSIDGTGKYLRIKVTGSSQVGFEIGDISIIYREKSIK